MGNGEKLGEIFELMDSGRYGEAEEELISMGNPGRNAQGLEWLNLYGYVLCGQKKFDDALRKYDEYLDIAEFLKSTEERHIGLHQKAFVYREMKDYGKAMEMIREEYDLLLRNFPEDPLKMGANFYEQGYLTFLEGNAEQAESLMERALSFAEESGDPVMLGCAYRGLGEIYQALGRKELSAEAFQKAQDCFSEAGVRPHR